MCQCPFGLISHFYFNMTKSKMLMKGLKCQCPLGLIPHFYCMDSTGLMPMRTRVSMPSRAYTSFLLCSLQAILQYLYSCQCPLGLIPHFYIKTLYTSIRKAGCVNALSGLYLISTQKPLYFVKATGGVNALSGLYLISTQKPLYFVKATGGVNALSGLYLISTERMRMDLHLSQIEVSMPSRAYTSFLRYPFKNLGFMRFPEPVFAGIYQNILTTAVFRAC